MSQYGVMLDTTADPLNEQVYESFVQYFNNPVLAKIKNVEQYSMYG